MTIHKTTYILHSKQYISNIFNSDHSIENTIIRMYQNYTTYKYTLFPRTYLFFKFYISFFLNYILKTDENYIYFFYCLTEPIVYGLWSNRSPINKYRSHSNKLHIHHSFQLISVCSFKIAEMDVLN